MVGTDGVVLVPPDPGHQKQAAEVLERLKRGEASQYESVRKREDGAVIDVLITASSHPRGDGRTVGFSAVMRDISARSA